MNLTIRAIEQHDEQRWRELWDAYSRFYEMEPSGHITRHTWNRLMDPLCPVFSVVAVDVSASVVIGFANYVLHENTSTIKPVCYLEDLFVTPDKRAAGVGHCLIDWLVAQMRVHGWARLYWHTREKNYRARGLYDKYTQRSDFVRYDLNNPDLA